MFRKRKKGSASARRKSRRKRKPIQKGAILKRLIMVAFFAWAGWEFVCYSSEVLAVATIGIQGAVTIDEEAIVDACDITTADNIFLLDVDAARERVLKMPHVKDCRVRRIFPDMVVISIEERHPEATVLIDNRAYEIDNECVVLCQLSMTAGHTGPYITNVPDLANVSPGEQLDARSLSEALAVWRAFSGISMAEDVVVSEIAAVKHNDIRMYCDELPFEIRWGRGDYQTQALRLDLLWNAKDKELNFDEYVDLRYGQNLACK
jgi:cell division protein FtsQ